jgi:hypothetical protein
MRVREARSDVVQDVTLPEDVRQVLREVGLQEKANYDFLDIQAVGLVTDYAQLRRLRQRPPPAPRFPGGLWVGDNRHIWTPFEIGTYVLALRRWSESRTWWKKSRSKKSAPVPAATSPVAVTEVSTTALVPTESATVAPTKRRRIRRSTETASTSA